MKRNNYIISVWLLLSGVCPVAAQQTLGLDECRRLALENNAGIKTARLDVEGAKEGKKEALTKYFPTVSATGSVHAANKGLLEMNLGGMEMAMMKNGVVGGITAVQPVFAGGQIVNGNKLAHLGEEVSRYQMKQTEDEVSLNVEQYYRQVVSLREKLKTIGIMESLVDNLYKDVKVSVDAGVTTRNDLLQVQLKRNSLSSNRLQVENSLKLAKMQLAQYIGMPEEGFTVADHVQDELPSPLMYKVDHRDVLPSTVAYKLLDKNVEASRLQHKMKLGEYLPSVGVGAGYVYDNLMDTDHSFGMVFATVSIPISGWWGGSHALRKQKLQIKAAEYTRDNNNELLLVRMQQFWNELEEAYKQAKLSEESIATAEENVRLNTDYYKAGTSTMSDLLDAQSLLQQSRDQYTDDYTLYLVKRTQYLLATGR